MRLLLLYLRSRHVPMAIAGAVGVVAALWWIDQLSDHRLTERLALLAVVAATVAAGPGLAGADVDLDRTAAIGWPPRRAVHLLAIGGAVIGIVTAASLTGDGFAPAGEVVRDTAGMVGLLALSAALFGAARAWLPPVVWALAALTGLLQRWQPPPDQVTDHRMLTWMLHPADSAVAGWTAAGLAVAGVLAYAFAGPRPARL